MSDQTQIHETEVGRVSRRALVMYGGEEHRVDRPLPNGRVRIVRTRGRINRDLRSTKKVEVIEGTYTDGDGSQVTVLRQKHPLPYRLPTKPITFTIKVPEESLAGFDHALRLAARPITSWEEAVDFIKGPMADSKLDLRPESHSVADLTLFSHLRPSRMAFVSDPLFLKHARKRDHHPFWEIFEDGKTRLLHLGKFDSRGVKEVRSNEDWKVPFFLDLSEDDDRQRKATYDRVIKERDRLNSEILKESVDVEAIMKTPLGLVLHEGGFAVFYEGDDTAYVFRDGPRGHGTWKIKTMDVLALLELNILRDVTYSTRDVNFPDEVSANRPDRRIFKINVAEGHELAPFGFPTSPAVTVSQNRWGTRVYQQEGYVERYDEDLDEGEIILRRAVESPLINYMDTRTEAGTFEENGHWEVTEKSGKGVSLRFGAMRYYPPQWEKPANTMIPVSEVREIYKQAFEERDARNKKLFAERLWSHLWKHGLTRLLAFPTKGTIDRPAALYALKRAKDPLMTAFQQHTPGRFRYINSWVVYVMHFLGILKINPEVEVQKEKWPNGLRHCSNPVFFAHDLEFDWDAFPHKDLFNEDGPTEKWEEEELDDEEDDDFMDILFETGDEEEDGDDDEEGEDLDDSVEDYEAREYLWSADLRAYNAQFHEVYDQDRIVTQTEVMEGDETFIISADTMDGRGREPEFFKYLRSLDRHSPFCEACIKEGELALITKNATGEDVILSTRWDYDKNDCQSYEAAVRSVLNDRNEKNREIAEGLLQRFASTSPGPLLVNKNGRPPMLLFKEGEKTVFQYKYVLGGHGETAVALIDYDNYIALLVLDYLQPVSWLGRSEKWNGWHAYQYDGPEFWEPSTKTEEEPKEPADVDALCLAWKQHAGDYNHAPGSAAKERQRRREKFFNMLIERVLKNSKDIEEMGTSGIE